jgi:YHS domain-containing protein
MRSRTLLILLGLLLPSAFLAGWLASPGGRPSAPDARRVLYYVDPMNPAFHSPSPGTAPCGMPLEPVFADGAGAPAGGPTPPGAVTVGADRLQLVGVEREQVRARVLRDTVRLLGSVAADETRQYRITAATPGRIRELTGVTTGSMVEKGQVLGAYYAADMLLQQQYFLKLQETAQKTGTPARDVRIDWGAQSFQRGPQVNRQTLLNLGMPAEQIDEVEATRQPAPLVQLRAPTTGIVTARNVTPDQSFATGDRLYEFADLSRVWVLADALLGQQRFLLPGQRAVVTLPGSGERVEATVSQVLPRFAEETRTLQIRLEADNPGYVLRPGMFVDVEVPVEAGPAIFLPLEAVLDSGTRRVVFVEQAAGVFVPRTVATGRRLGRQVEIVGGLMEGETVVTAGNFLLDSESRMRAAGPAPAGAALDPVCGMEVDEAKARARGLVVERGGGTWFFCSPECKGKFAARADAGAATGSAGKSAPAMPRPMPPAPVPPMPAAPRMQMPMQAPMPMPAAGAAAPMPMPQAPAVDHPAHGSAPEPGMPGTVDPVCGMPVDETAARASGLVTERDGRTWYFCSPECKREFDANPRAHQPPGP